MNTQRLCRANHRAAGFTLAEAAVTIAIVSIALLMVLQGLQRAKFNAFLTKQQKTAYELGIGLLGEVQAGLYRDELDTGMSGDFADQDEPDFSWELLLGDEVFSESNRDADAPFDNYAEQRRRDEEREREERDFGEDEDEEPEEPFEKIKIRVTFPPVGEAPNEVILERWVDWEEIYGEPEEEEVEDPGADPNAGGTGGNSGSAAGGTQTATAAGGLGVGGDR